MGLLSKILAVTATKKIIQRMDTTGRTPSGQVTTGNAPVTRSGSILDRAVNNPYADRAVDVYRKNPKMVAGLGVAAAALVLHSLTRKRGY
jgi:hypothetical protein